MLENDFYLIWKNSISLKWPRGLGDKMARIAWNQRHMELGKVSDKACKDACERLVMEPDIKFAPALGSIVNRILHENEPKPKNPLEQEEQNYTPADPHFADEMWACARVMAGGNDQRKLETIDMIPGICKRYNVPFSESAREQYNLLKIKIQARMKAEAPQRKAEAAHAKKLTKAEWIARMKRRRAESKTLGNALGGVLK